MTLKTVGLIVCAVLAYLIFQQEVRLRDAKLNRAQLASIRFGPTPEQQATRTPAFAYKNHTVIPLARFNIRARVMSAEAYRLDRGAHVSPIDLALAWGRLAEGKQVHVLGVDCTAHHARLPMPFVKRNMWINLAIDVGGIVKECFKVITVSPLLCYCLTSSL